MTISELCQEAHAIALEKGWWNGEKDHPRNVGEQLALMHSELSEALEEYRDGHELTEVYYNHFLGDQQLYSAPLGFPIELADLLIRVADTCGRYGIDLDAALRAKLDYNRVRPYRHGGKRA